MHPACWGPAKAYRAERPQCPAMLRRGVTVPPQGSDGSWVPDVRNRLRQSSRHRTRTETIPDCTCPPSSRRADGTARPATRRRSPHALDLSTRMNDSSSKASISVRAQASSERVSHPRSPAIARQLSWSLPNPLSPHPRCIRGRGEVTIGALRPGMPVRGDRLGAGGDLSLLVRAHPLSRRSGQRPFPR